MGVIDFSYGAPLGPLDPKTGEPLKNRGAGDVLQSFDLSAWPETSPPPRNWFLRAMAPAGAATVIHGDGGTGKSRIGMQGGIAATANVRFLDIQPEITGAAVFFSAEMPGTDCWRMLDEVSRGMGLTDEQKRSVAENLHIIDLAENGPPLLYGPEGWTYLGTQVLSTVAALKPALVVVDSASSTYSAAGFEMAPIYDFLRGFTREIGEAGALFMLLHEGKAGLREGNRTHSYMGSVGWHTAARSRWDITRDKEDDDRIVLAPHKSSYSDKAKPIDLVYSNGAFLPPAQDDFLDGIRAKVDAKDAVRIIARLADLGQSASPSMTANNNVAALARKCDLLHGLTTSRLWAGIAVATSNGWLSIEEIKRGRNNPSRRYVVTGEGWSVLAP